MTRLRLTWIEIAVIIFFFLFVYFVLTRIFGHSATDAALAFSSFFILGGALYALNRELGELKLTTIHSFGLMKNDMNRVKHDMGEIKKDVGEMKKDIVDLKRDSSLLMHGVHEINETLKRF